MPKRRISVVMPYYRNPGMLARQYRVWSAEWPQALRDVVEIIIVDDGSPDEKALDVPRPDGLPLVKIYRVLEDRPWHQHGARNLGAHVATTTALFLTDMDHVIPAATLDDVLSRGFGVGRGYYTFARVDAPAGEWKSSDALYFRPTTRGDGSHKPHPNTFAMPQRTFHDVGGYDEDYCGIYGTDGLFRKRLAAKVQGWHLGMPIIRVAREIIADASTRDATRKDGRSPGAKRLVAERKKAEGRADVIRFLDFPWEKQL